eukprot:CAMPEP_0179479980 /NCGR_PEP_ID=MMETSP0799-20121207/58079_1 /TAXON_ID=46947 /ORGANISM="Geminigera cryophila, Strain CCMP2564" /LENGTH=43 /DNA_ID= /DNA_START= /DNA_END= /DNA_ORIENTATION=
MESQIESRERDVLTQAVALAMGVGEPLDKERRGAEFFKSANDN